MLTVYGIETQGIPHKTHLTILVATVLTVYGIETLHATSLAFANSLVATVLTVYGIETSIPPEYV